MKNSFNRNYIRWGWLFFICLSFTLVAMAGVRDSIPKRSLIKDTAGIVSVRAFSTQQLDHYRNSKDFQYQRSTSEVLSWWDRLKLWFWSMVDRLLYYTVNTPLGNAIAICCVVLLIIYAAFKMAGADKGWFFEKDRNLAQSFYVNEEEINAIDFERSIDEAVSLANYRMAIRLWYLMSLKKLADKGLIHWKPGKTNYEYIRELKGSSYADPFTRLTNSFEFFWYGESHLMPSEYEQVRDHFSSFNKQFS